GILGSFRRRLRALAAGGDKPRHAVGGDIAAGHLESGPAQRGRHAKTHRAEPDYGHARFCGFGHRRILPGAAFVLRLDLWVSRLGRAAKAWDNAIRGIRMSDTKIREGICRFGRSLFERGLTPGSSGNISVKLDDGSWLVTPTNASLGFLDAARLSHLGSDGRLLSGDAPTKEVPLHGALYQTRNAARAVVHLHSTHSVALSMLPEIDPRAALPPLTPYYLMRCGATALLPYYRPGDPAVADAIKGL